MMGFFDTVLDIGGDVLDFATDNFKPIANAAYGLYSADRKADARNDLVNYYEDREQQNLQNIRDRQEYEQRLAALRAAGGGRGGGGGGSRVSPAALQEAMNKRLALIKQAQNIYRPYEQTGREILPLMSAMYKQGQQGLGGLYGAVASPQKLKNISKPTITPSQASIPIPERMRG
jgi:hypothetical protein